MRTVIVARCHFFDVSIFDLAKSIPLVPSINSRNPSYNNFAWSVFFHVPLLRVTTVSEKSNGLIGFNFILKKLYVNPIGKKIVHLSGVQHIVDSTGMGWFLKNSKWDPKK